MTPKTHSFDVECAKVIGVDCAIVLASIAWWVGHNKANRRNFRNGRHWTYNSAKAWSELLPYFTPKQIRRILEELESAGLILKDNFNENTYDRTLWYSLTEKGESICLSGKMEGPVAEDGDPDPVLSIDSSIPVQNQTKAAAGGKPDSEIVFPPILCTPAFGMKWKEWLEYRRKVKRDPVKPATQRRQLERLAAIGEAKARACIDQSMDNQWSGLFPEKFAAGGAKFQGKTGGTFSESQYGENPFGDTAGGERQAS
jgi:hypothetical protein